MAFQLLRYRVGLDISKDKFHACISAVTKEEKIKIVASRKFANTPSGFTSFVEWLIKYKKQKQLSLSILLKLEVLYVIVKQ